ncbi:histidinol-phosphatase (PHP family) [Marinococcus luteus]|uniref:Histidinol-phosphatase n=1 Tax=Marinococcus luteus TaxID=1122204 RepID=A0A1H2VPN1_9BACI|nr:histidinol-phosphatase HisJ [Marinococcus luteus]SDW70362.1 histidinol-phosphatase (PHP family) [Marinococcus luteus]
MTIIRDGHIHSPFCPHGSRDSFHDYIEACIKNGIKTISFTEHAPLPEGFTDPVPDKDSAMPAAQLDQYLQDLSSLQSEYNSDITIKKGLEVDFIEGFEKKTEQFMNTYGPELEDCILSSHFIKLNSEYICIDFSPDHFDRYVRLSGSPQKAAELYYSAVLRSIQAPLGKYTPNRIGHMTLIRKFHKNYEYDFLDQNAIEAILQEVKSRGFELDVNGAGTIKERCLEPYPHPSVIQSAVRMGIPLVYGSDAHASSGLLAGSNDISALTGEQLR